MTKTLLAAAAVLLLGAGPTFAQMPEKKPMDKSAAGLMQKEEAMLTSIVKKDWTTFKSLMLPDAWSLDENGAMSIADFLKMTADPKFDLSIQQKASDMKVIDVDATSKLVTYKLEQKGTMMGQPFPPVVYATTVWVNRGGAWKAIFHQESTAAPKQPNK